MIAREVLAEFFVSPDITGKPERPAHTALVGGQCRTGIVGAAGWIPGINRWAAG